MNLKHMPIAFDAKAVRDDGSFEGYASVFGNLDAARDIVAPGAFAATLKSPRRVKMLWQHDAAVPIGRWTGLAEDSRGLHARGQIIRAVPRGEEAYALMKGEAVDGLSIGFRTIDEDLDLKSGIRTLKAVDLFEISVVTFPANDMATIDRRGTTIDEAELEADFRAAGLSPKAVDAALDVLRRSRATTPPSQADTLLHALRRATATLAC